MHTDTKSVFICVNPWLKKTCVSGTLTMAKKNKFLSCLTGLCLAQTEMTLIFYNRPRLKRG